MPEQVRLFDRVELLQAIEDQCLGTRGTSGLLFCPQKVGKSYLLDHLAREKPRPHLIFCRMNLDMLRAEHGTATGSLDQTFFRYFLRRLQADLATMLESQEADEVSWNKRLVDVDAKLGTLAHDETPEGTQQRELVEQVKKALQQSLKELGALRRAVERIDEILSKSCVEISEVAGFLLSLQRMKRRVVLLIDDYHRIIADRALSDGVFSFLRGGNSDETIIILASSPKHLMDDSLHRGDNERAALFNQFYVAPLRPFKKDEPEEFLKWLEQDGDALEADERTYVRELGGGSPFFLQQVRDEFIRAGRPQAGPQRDDFERLLVRSLQGPFWQIWTRCSPKQRSQMRLMADGTPATARMVQLQMIDDGYLVEVGGDIRIFSRLFADYIKQQPAGDEYEGVTVVPLITYNVFPTAIAYAKADLPLVTFTVSNQTDAPITVKLECELIDCSYLAKDQFAVPRYEVQTRGLAVAMQQLRMKTFNDPQNIPIRLLASRDVNGVRRDLEDKTVNIVVLPIDYFTFARRDTARGVLIDFTWLIAAWVGKNEPGLIPIKQAAAEGGALHGYGDTFAGAVRNQVKRLYDALKANGFRYDSNASVFHQEKNDFAQRVRRVGRLLQEKGGNCLEGCVLFASLLSAADLHPVILFVPGHAIVGWKAHAGAGPEWFFLDTTVIADSDFDRACEVGQDIYVKYREKVDQWLADPIDEIRTPLDFAIPVDIHKVWADRKLVPLPRHED